jgi:hypothetical protein
MGKVDVREKDKPLRGVKGLKLKVKSRRNKKAHLTIDFQMGYN